MRQLVVSSYWLPLSRGLFFGDKCTCFPPPNEANREKANANKVNIA